METKTVTLRLPHEVADYITRDGSGMTDGVKEIVKRLQLHERYADMELRGRFTPNEWKCLVDSFNSTLMADDLRFVPTALVAHNQDSQLYDGSADKWGVNLDELNKKCEALSASQVEALYRRIEKFWANPSTDLEEWAKY